MRRITSFLIITVLLLSLSTSAFAWSPVVQHDYSFESNSGVRHEVCITLDGTSVSTYYTGDYTFDILSDLGGDALLQTLRTLMTSTHTHKTRYNDCRDMAVKTDCENGDGTNISLLYSSYTATWEDWINNRTGGWNREHVWPKSLGGFGNEGAGADLHHVRPSDSTINGKRDNTKYGEVNGGSHVTGTAVTENAPGGTLGGGYFEPLDNAKGDVARICLYVWARYGGELSQCSAITNVFQSVDVLLQWHESDPVDTWEMGRNEVVYGIQGNRNAFIDYPELAWLVFDREIPEGVTTPSSSANNCEHTHTELRNVKDATCAETGFSGDAYCIDCNALVTAGVTIPTTEHKNTEIRNKWAATCGEPGCTGDIYCLDCKTVVKVGDLIPATGKHKFSDWISNEEFSCRTCVDCQFEEVDYSRTSATADNSRTVIIVAVAAVVILGSLALVFFHKKRKR